MLRSKDDFRAWALAISSAPNSYWTQVWYRAAADILPYDPVLSAKYSAIAAEYVEILEYIRAKVKER